MAEDNPVALGALTACAWLAPESVPFALLTSHHDELPLNLADTAKDPLSFTATTSILRRRGLASVTKETLHLHRVPAALLRAHTANEVLGEPGGWIACVLRLLRTTVPPDPWNNPPVWPEWRRLLPHVLAACSPDRPANEQTSWLLGRAASYLNARGEPRAARQLYQRAYDLHLDQFGENHPETLALASNLAINLRTLGRFTQAWEMDEDILRRRRELFGGEHPDTPVSASNLAIDLRTLGHYD